MASYPWYDARHRWDQRADACLAAYRSLKPDSPQVRQVQSYARQSAVRMIFESNLMELAGPSLGETRDIIEGFPSIPDAPTSADWKDHPLQRALEPEKWAAIAQAAKSLRYPDRIVPSVRFRRKSRPVREVALHWLAYERVEIAAKHYSLVGLGRWVSTQRSPACTQIRRDIAKIIGDVDRPDWREFASALSADVAPSRLPPAPLLSPSFVRRIHAVLAHGLLPPGCGVKAGEWRRTDVSVGNADVVFPAPDLVPAAMDRFCERFADPRSWKGRPVEFAADMSFEFVDIHPFPDFNGRMSRLLLNLGLIGAGVPFRVALRADKKGRARYLRALDRAHRGRRDHYRRLIDMAVVEGFEEINRELRAAYEKPIGGA